jgi:hypothetical protein
VIAFAAGGGGVFGGLGSLFGRNGASLQVAQAAAPDSDIVAAPTAAERRATLTPVRAPARREPRRTPSRVPSRTPPAPVIGLPPSGPAPVNPAPTVPAPPAPAPPPAPVVTAVGQAVKDVTSQAPPDAQPITKPIDVAVDRLVQTCASLPVCP